jgi:sugar lactone lactonase YvrE
VIEWQAFSDTPDALGESPFWHPRERTLYWVDIPSRRVRRMREGAASESWDMPSEPGCIAPVRGGGLFIALRDAVYHARGWQQSLALVARFGHDAATTRFNDGKADPVGRFWAGTMYEPKDARKGELYSVDLRAPGRDGQPTIQVKASNAVTANGLAWSPDARTVYWSDTQHHVLQAWDWQADSNAMTNHRVLRRFPEKPRGWQPGDPGYGGRPDGAAVDAEGNYWCAMYEGGQLLKLSPAGETLEEIPVPAQCPTMPCFGGDDLRTLFVTTARRGRPEDELRGLPLSGLVLAARVDVPGLPVNFVIA